MSLAQLHRQLPAKNPYFVDAVLALAIVGLNLSFLTVPHTPSSRPVNIWAVLLVTLPNVAIIFRRRWPAHLLLPVAATGFIFWVVGYSGAGSAATTMVLLYSVPLHTKSRQRATHVSMAFFSTLLIVFVAGYFYTPEEDVTVGMIIANVVTFQIVWLAGEALARRRAAIIELKKQVLREQERQQSLAAQAVITEQNRIARELHDIVAHSMSVVVVQAQGAQRMVGSDNDMVETALHSIESTGRQTLNDIRGIVGLLRKGGEHQPAPTLEMVDKLAAESKQAGLATTIEIGGEMRQVPMMIDLSAYRIIQESLTNVRKHGGPRASAFVKIDYEPNWLQIRISDTGRGAAANLNGSSGFGLIGMRERVEAFGGHLEHGPQSGGGYAVKAVLPMEAL